MKKAGGATSRGETSRITTRRKASPERRNKDSLPNACAPAPEVPPPLTPGPATADTAPLLTCHLAVRWTLPPPLMLEVFLRCKHLVSCSASQLPSSSGHSQELMATPPAAIQSLPPVEGARRLTSTRPSKPKQQERRAPVSLLIPYPKLLLIFPI